MNSLAIADALAARFVGLTAGGESLASVPTARLPNSIGAGPVILVYPPTGSGLDIGPSAMRTDLYTFEVRLLRDPLDSPTRHVKLYEWFDAMHDLIGLDMDLGLGSYVNKAEPVTCRLELDGETYGGSKFDVVELIVEVLIREHVTVGV